MISIKIPRSQFSAVILCNLKLLLNHNWGGPEQALHYVKSMSACGIYTTVYWQKFVHIYRVIGFKQQRFKGRCIAAK